MDDVVEIIQGLRDSIFKCKAFTIRKIEDFRINDYIDVDTSNISSDIVGCNGHKYFINLKKYVFNEDLDIRDLYFRMDGDLAIWNMDNLKVEL